MNSMSMMGTDLRTLCKNWGWFFTWGIVLVLLGAFAIYAATMTTLISVVILGVLISIAGIMVLADAYSAWRKHNKSRYLFRLLVGILYLVAGVMLIENPIMGSVSITFLLGAFYIAIGIFRIMDSFSYRYLSWGWSTLNGFITLILGLFILASWPASSLFIIGLFVGIDLVFCGFAYIMAAMSAHKFLKH